MKLRPFALWFLVFLSLITGIVFTVTDFFEKVDTFSSDVFHVLSGVRHQPNATVIASLDSEALAAYPNTPLVFWGPHFAQAIERLREAGAAVIAIDMLFSITPEQWLRTVDGFSAMPPKILDYDQTFDQALSEGGVILAANPIPENNRVPVPLPAGEYVAALPNLLGDIGLTILPRDSDATIRKMIPAFEGLPATQKDGAKTSGVPDGYATPNPWWTLAALAVKKAKPELAVFQGKSIYSAQLIDFCGPPKTIPRISLAALFREQGLSPEERALVSGRIVFIGADYENFGDHQPTPYSQDFLWLGYRDMSGVEIHANIAEMLWNNREVQAVPLAGRILIWGIILAVSNYLCELSMKLEVDYLIEFCSVIILWPLGYAFFRMGYHLPQYPIFLSISLFFLAKETLQSLGEHERTVRIIGAPLFDKIFTKEVANPREDPDS